MSFRLSRQELLRDVERVDVAVLSHCWAMSPLFKCCYVSSYVCLICWRFDLNVPETVFLLNIHLFGAFFSGAISF